MTQTCHGNVFNECGDMTQSFHFASCLLDCWWLNPYINPDWCIITPIIKKKEMKKKNCFKFSTCWGSVIKNKMRQSPADQMSGINKLFSYRYLLMSVTCRGAVSIFNFHPSGSLSPHLMYVCEWRQTLDCNSRPGADKHGDDMGLLLWVAPDSPCANAISCIRLCPSW